MSDRDRDQEWYDSVPLNQHSSGHKYCDPQKCPALKQRIHHFQAHQGEFEDCTSQICEIVVEQMTAP